MSKSTLAALFMLLTVGPLWAEFYSCQQPNGTILLQDHPGLGCVRHEVPSPSTGAPPRTETPTFPPSSKDPDPKTPLVRIESVRCLYDYGWVRVRGELRNTSDQMLRFLKVVAF